MQILLVDPADEVRRALHAGLTAEGDNHHSIIHVRPRTPQAAFLAEAERADVVMFGLGVREQTVVRFATLLRSRNFSVPVFAVTREFEMGVPSSFMKAGVDAMLNVRELDTPLISWTFESSVKQAEIKRKARDFDLLSSRLASLAEQLATLTHDINNPLSIVRLAVYHLQTYDAPAERREMLLKLVTENIDKVQSRLDELRVIRRTLPVNGDATPAPSPEPLLHSTMKR